MSLFKTITRKKIVQRFLCWLGAIYIRFIYASTRWQTVRGEIPEALHAQNKPFIVCLWHGRILLMPYAWNRTHPIHMLISTHPDGQLIAGTIAHFGLRTIAGSTTRGGTAALRGLLKVLKAGDCIGVTPDGPRGPRMRASDGIINIARLAGVPIVPASYSVTKRRVLGSWDRFILALPFSHGAMVWGDPIHIERDADEATLEAARHSVEENTNAVTAEADALCGHAPLDPAPLPEQIPS